MAKEHAETFSVKVAILTASDRSSRGEREDISGREIAKMVTEAGWEVVSHTIVADDKKMLKKELIRLSDELKVNLILTTGGTGLAPRDFTPDATLEVIEKNVPGLTEAMRQESLKKTPHAMLSRAVSGVRGSTLIVNLPGSPRAVRECLNVILPAIPHAVALLGGGVSDCARM
ncbi:MAG: molybdopterin adenylyltransferase [Bacillota bacterium]